MSAVSELKITLSLKENMSVGIAVLIKKEDQLKKNTFVLGNVLKKVFEKDYSLKLGTKMRKAEVAKARKELEKKFESINASISSTTIGKSMNNLKKWAREKVINTKIGVAVSKEGFDLGVQDFKRKALMKVEKPIESIKQKLQPLKKASYMAIALKDMTGNGLKTLAVKPRKILESVASMGKNAFSKVAKFAGSAVGGIKKAGTDVLGFGKAVFKGLGGTVPIISRVVKDAVKSGAELEKQNLYMDQAIAASNPQLGSEEAKMQRNSYMKQLRDSAAGTGMDSGDIVAAGTQAVSITGGDTKEAMELVKVAQDMAALNPGKTVAEAMDALAAAKGGDTAGLEAFGAKIASDDISKLGLGGVVQHKLKPQFEGGAEKLSDTGAGLVSVIKGKLNNKMQDMGLGIIEKLKPALESVVMLIDRYSPALDAFGEGIASGIGVAMNWVQNIAGLIGEKFSWIGEKTGFLKEVFQASWAGIQNRMITAWGIIQPIIDLIANGAMLLFNIFQWAFPGIQAIIENVWTFVRPLLEGLGSAIGWVADKIGMVAEWLGKEKSSGGGGSGAGAFLGNFEDKKNKPVMSASATAAVFTQPAVGKGPQYGAALNTDKSYKNGIIPKGYTAPGTKNSDTGYVVQNPQITININGSNLSAQEITSRLVPQLKLALQNMNPKPSSRIRIGGALA